jgi:hypothetical protein
LRLNFAACVARRWAGRLPDSDRQIAAAVGQIVSIADYLRAAQAYMLISMPTGTSTIFGVFQVIQVSQVTCKFGATSHRG